MSIFTPSRRTPKNARRAVSTPYPYKVSTSTEKTRPRAILGVKICLFGILPERQQPDPDLHIMSTSFQNILLSIEIFTIFSLFLGDPWIFQPGIAIVVIVDSRYSRWTFFVIVVIVGSRYLHFLGYFLSFLLCQDFANR